MFPMRRAVVRRRPLLRAAVVGGGAYAAGRAAAGHSAEPADQEAQQDARISDLEQEQQHEQEEQQTRQGEPVQAPHVPPQARAAVVDSGSSGLLDQLNELVAMHDRGALTDEEFTAAKARLLA
jgi:hypothetical protein